MSESVMTDELIDKKNQQARDAVKNIIEEKLE